VAGLDFSKTRPIIKNQAVNLQTNEVALAERSFYFVVVLILMFNSDIMGQENIPHFSTNSKKIQFNPLENKPLRLTGPRSLPFLYFPGIPTKRLSPVPQNFYTKNLGFFCKREWEWEKKSSIPLRLRLGSVPYVDHLEGKNPGYFRN